MDHMQGGRNRKTGKLLTGNLWGEEVAPLEGVYGAQGLQCSMVVTHERVHSQQAHQAEVPNHAQHICALVVPLCCVEALLPSCRDKGKNISTLPLAAFTCPTVALEGLRLSLTLAQPQQAHQAEVAHHAQHVCALIIPLFCVKLLLHKGRMQMLLAMA